MAFYFGTASKAKLKGVHPDLVSVMEKGITNCPYDIRITQGVRTAAYQYSLYKQGRPALGGAKGSKVVTYCDGYKKKSNHQVKSDGLGWAIDFVVLDKTKKDGLDWSSVNKYTAIARHFEKIARENGIVIKWGGDFKSFKDYPHLELVKPR